MYAPIKEGCLTPEKVVLRTGRHLLGQVRGNRKGGLRCWPAWPDLLWVLAGGSGYTSAPDH